MKFSLLSERPPVQFDSIAFLADPELIRALTEHATPFVCDTDRVLFHQDDPPGVCSSSRKVKSRSA